MGVVLNLIPLTGKSGLKCQAIRLFYQSMLAILHLRQIGSKKKIIMMIDDQFDPFRNIISEIFLFSVVLIEVNSMDAAKGYDDLPEISVVRYERGFAR